MEAIYKDLSSDRRPSWASLAAAACREFHNDTPALPHHPLNISISHATREVFTTLLAMGVHPSRPVHLFRGTHKVCEIGSLSIAAEHGVPQ
jgi:hypothetical protein